MKESLEELKAIRDGAPEGATECLIVLGEVYYLKLDGVYLHEWLESHKQWHRNVFFEDVNAIRSLSDINRIIELMEKVNDNSDERINQIARNGGDGEHYEKD